MEDTIQRYHPLGTRTLLIFIFRKSGILFFLLLVLIAGWWLLHYVPFELINIAINIEMGVLFLFIALLVIIFSLGWLQYIRYWIFIDDKDVKIARGLIAIEEVGIPYRHIKDIKIERSLLDQLFGVSDIIVTVLGGDENQETERESQLVLPAVSKQIALSIQNIVLKKAQVEQVSVLGNRPMK